MANLKISHSEWMAQSLLPCNEIDALFECLHIHTLSAPIPAKAIATLSLCI